MKKKIILMLLTLLIVPLSIYATNINDINTHWASPYITELINRNIVKGYPDGTFKPDKELTVGEFLSLTIKLSLTDKIENPTEGHWATNYYNIALQRGLINNELFTKSQLDNKITRLQASVIITNLLRTSNEEFDYSKFDNTITDINTISQKDSKFIHSVLFSYYNGIITGYPDKSFKPYKTLTRAESTVIILRCIDKKYRKTPKLNETLTKISISKLESDKLLNSESFETNYINKEFILTGYAKEITHFGKGHDSDFYNDCEVLSIYDGNGKYSKGLRIPVKMGKTSEMSDEIKLLLKSINTASGGYNSLPAGDYIELPVKYLGKGRYILLTD